MRWIKFISRGNPFPEETVTTFFADFEDEGNSFKFSFPYIGFLPETSEVWLFYFMNEISNNIKIVFVFQFEHSWNLNLFCFVQWNLYIFPFILRKILFKIVFQCLREIVGVCLFCVSLPRYANRGGTFIFLYCNLC